MHVSNSVQDLTTCNEYTLCSVLYHCVVYIYYCFELGKYLWRDVNFSIWIACGKFEHQNNYCGWLSKHLLTLNLTFGWKEIYRKSFI